MKKREKSLLQILSDNVSYFLGDDGIIERDIWLLLIE